MFFAWAFEAGVIGYSLHPLRATAQASNSHVFAILDSCLVPYDCAYRAQRPVVLRHSPLTHLCYSYSMHVQAKLEVWGDQIKMEGSCVLIAANSSLGQKIWQLQRCLFCPTVNTFHFLTAARCWLVAPSLPFFFFAPRLRNSEFNVISERTSPALVLRSSIKVS